MTSVLGDFGPFSVQLRRYARALTVNPTAAMTLYDGALKALTGPGRAHPEDMGRLQLYRIVTGIWNGLMSDIALEAKRCYRPVPNSSEQRRLSRMSLLARQAYVLTTMEGFSFPDVATILGVRETAVSDLVELAISEANAQDSARVMIIEDEFLVAKDLERIVSSMGHRVVCNVRTRSAAVAAIGETEPDLIMADVHLADGTSGIDAVNDVLEVLGGRPVVFITAFSEELLHGLRPNPTVLISKPYSVEEVRSAIGQVLFFNLASSRRTAVDSAQSSPLVKYTAAR